MSGPRHTALVTGIGGDVGQGVLRVLRSLPHQLRLIGTNTERVSAGNHLCDAVHEVPWAWERDYVESMAAICDREAVDLLIPSTDHEAYELAKGADALPAVAGSSASTAEAFLDKHRTAERFAAIGLPFAPTVLPSGWANQFPDRIVKPRRGRGSRNLHINPSDVSAFDDNFVVQTLLVGTEITTGFYVTRQGNVHGALTFTRSLRAGTTVSCEVTHRYDAEIERIVRTVAAEFEVRGSCNIQSIVTESGVVPFEVNGRVSGTCSIRHHFGLRDVQWTVEERLFGLAPDPPHYRGGSALRLLHDVIYFDTPLASIRDASTEHILS